MNQQEPGKSNLSSSSDSASSTLEAPRRTRLREQQKALKPGSDPAFREDKDGNRFLDVTLIDVVDRARKDYEGIVELSLSLMEHTLISPISVKPAENGRYRLVAGGRRLKAFMLTGERWIPAIIRDHKDELDDLEAELEENLNRKDLHWSEYVFLTERIHTTKQKIYGIALGAGGKGWGVEKTAKILGGSPSAVSTDLKLAQELRGLSPKALESIKRFDKTTALREINRQKVLQKTTAAFSAGEITIESDFQNLDASVFLRKISTDSVDMILTDPPYGDSGVVIDGSKQKSTSQTQFHVKVRPNDNLSEEDMKSLLTKVIPELFRVLKPSSYMLLFFSFEHYAWLYERLVKAGFLVDHTPLIWDKERPIQAASGTNFPNSYEPIFFCTKPPRGNRRFHEAQRNIIKAPIVPSKERLHPFQKPLALLERFIQILSNPGDLILDPFAGSASTLKAANNTRRRAIGCELDPENYAAGLLTLSQKPPELLPAKA